MSNAQDANKATTDSPPDRSSEAYVIEQSINRWTFENDGTGTRENIERVRIQSDAGIERFGLLTFPYQKATETVEIDYVRVRKPDGSAISTPLDDLQDMPAQVTREAPLYSDLREKHLAVKGLSKGDVLEFRCHWNQTKPLVPGQFWTAFNFSSDEIILEEQWVVSVPAERAIKLSSRGVKPVISQEGPRRVYTWKLANLEHKPEHNLDFQISVTRGRFPSPDVQLSTFQSWEEVGRWYEGLQRERVTPSPEVRAKAAELVRNAPDDAAKLQAIYKYVSTEYRYIGIDFGIGRYQPHSASEVLNNQYGDCKDKHTLLASLLAAAGIPAYPALINSSHIIDPEVPSPTQFDHVITVVPLGKEWFWLDTTTEVGPFGYLAPPLRNKQALVLLSDKPASFQTTPANLPYPSLWTFKIEAKLDDSGTLEGKVEQTIRGDQEVNWRIALRSLSRTQWKDLIQRISFSLGFAGEVSDVTATMPEATETPLHFTYNYKRKEYPDWANHRISPPAPLTIFLPPPEEEGKLPEHLWVGEPGEFQFESRVALPKGYVPDLPAKKDFQQDFAEYHVTYAFENDLLVAKYHVLLKIDELSGSSVNDYKTFADKVHKDQGQFIPLGSQQARSPEQAMLAFQQRVWELPDSTNPQALRSEKDAQDALQQRSLRDAVAAFKRAVTQDPKFTRDWIFLGQMYMAMMQKDDAISAFRQAVESDRQQALPYKTLAFALTSQGQRTEAIKVWQDLAKVAPEDRDIPVNMGNLLIAEKRYRDAVPYFEASVKLYPKQPASLIGLATAYLQTGDEEKAMGLFQQLMQIDSGAGVKNNIAYALAVANKRTEDALRYAQQAVHEEEDASRSVKLSGLAAADLQHTRNLANYWDTLGWVHYRLGNLKQAEGYLYSAWMVLQDPVSGFHLGQVYERQQRKQVAAHMYGLATGQPVPGSKFVTLDQLSSGDENNEAIEEAKKGMQRLKVSNPSFPINAGGELSQNRTTKLPRLVAEQASAEFFVLLAPSTTSSTGAPAHARSVKPSGATVTSKNVESATPSVHADTARDGVIVTRDGVIEGMKFIGGSDLLQSAGKALGGARFKVAFPVDSSARLVRRGFLTCYPSSGCIFVLLPIEMNRPIEMTGVN